MAGYVVDVVVLVVMFERVLYVAEVFDGCFWDCQDVRVVFGDVLVDLEVDHYLVCDGVLHWWAYGAVVLEVRVVLLWVVLWDLVYVVDGYDGRCLGCLSLVAQ